MAQAMAAAAVHSMPPFPLPAIPRVRPPPIPKGTPGPNTLSMPSELPRDPRKVWADGQWVSPKYKAAKHKQAVISRQLEKALQHDVRGMNIYAYKHVRTNQVVYSLTKNMENNKIMKQLLFHGKKTVPSALRRDMWRPYFSVHFPQTPDGASKGLKVYKELRELSLRRQLDPPKFLKLSDEQDVKNFKVAFGGRYTKVTEQETVARGDKYKHRDIPIPGRPVHQVILAKRLMAQHGSSVADLSAVLTRLVKYGGGLKVSGPSAGEQELAKIEEKREKALALLNDRGVKRLQAIRKLELEKELEIDARKLYLQPKAGQVKLHWHTLTRLSTEYEGAFGSVGDEPVSLTMLRTTAKTHEAKLALDKVVAEIQAEKDLKRKDVETTAAARIDRELESKSPDERQQIEAEIEDQKQKAEGIINTQINEARELLKEYRDELRAYVAKHDSGEKSEKKIQRLRVLMRDELQYLEERKAALMDRHAKWCGPYAEISALVDQALTQIDTDNEKRLVEYTDKLAAEEKLRLRKNKGGVIVRWANMRDGTYGKSWPKIVFHEELEPKAVVKSKALTIRQYAHVDENEHPIVQQQVISELPRSNSVHVFGAGQAAGRYQSPEDLAKNASEHRQQRINDYIRTSTVQTRDDICALKALESKLVEQLELVDHTWFEIFEGTVWGEIQNLDPFLAQYRTNFKQEDYQYLTDMVAWFEESGFVVKGAEIQELTQNNGQVGSEMQSKQAEEIGLMLLETKVDLLKLQIDNPQAANAADVRARLIAMFDDRARYVSRYPAANEWVEKEELVRYDSPADSAVTRETGEAPDGVKQIQEFDRENRLIAPAVRRSKDQGAYAKKLEKLNDEIYESRISISEELSLRDEHEMGSTARLASESRISELNDRITTQKRARLQFIQENDVIFDKRAWAQFKRRENVMLESPKAKTTTAEAAEEEAPKGFWEQLMNFVRRK